MRLHALSRIIGIHTQCSTRRALPKWHGRGGRAAVLGLRNMCEIHQVRRLHLQSFSSFNKGQIILLDHRSKLNDVLGHA